jgi:hypothetical protein
MHGCASFPELVFSFAKPETEKLTSHVYFNFVGGGSRRPCKIASEWIV